MTRQWTQETGHGGAVGKLLRETWRPRFEEALQQAIPIAITLRRRRRESSRQRERWMSSGPRRGRRGGVDSGGRRDAETQAGRGAQRECRPPCKHLLALGGNIYFTGWPGMQADGRGRTRRRTSRWNGEAAETVEIDGGLCVASTTMLPVSGQGVWKYGGQVSMLVRAQRGPVPGEARGLIDWWVVQQTAGSGTPVAMPALCTYYST